MTRSVHAILIIGDDAETAGTPAPGAAPAALIIDADLQKRFEAPDIVRLHNRPSQAQVHKAFATMRRRVSRGELFVVLFAGHGDTPHAPGQGQLWYLSHCEWFDDNQLADELLKLPDGVDIVVISDCCYGEGFFTRGPTKLRRDLADERALTGAERKLLNVQSRALGDSLFAAFKQVSKDSPMVCISAASKDDEVATVELPHLTGRTASASAHQATYAALKADFEAHRPAGAVFHVDARPDDRFRDRVLGV